MSSATDYDRRRVHRCFHIDANRINASGRLAFMNQLQRWHEERIIQIQMAETAQTEAARGGTSRARKAYGYIFTRTVAHTPEEQDRLRRIEQLLFPGGATDQSERNDAEIVFNAGKYLCALVTNDGGSKTQPGGILGNREKLAAMGIQVMTDEEAVALVRGLIAQRDDSERERSRRTGEALPGWAGRD